MGQKTVRFSDLSGEIITRDDTLARIVIHEHPELGDSPVEIEALADEARAIEKAAVAVAVVDLYLPGEDEPRRVAMEVAAFDQLATDRPMSELLLTARPARRAAKSAAAGRPGPTAPTTRPWSTPGSRTRGRSPRRSGTWSAPTWTRSTSGWPRRGCAPISPADPEHVERYGLEGLAAEHGGRRMAPARPRRAPRSQLRVTRGRGSPARRLTVPRGSSRPQARAVSAVVSLCGHNRISI